MSGFIEKEINRASWKLLLSNAALLAAVMSVLMSARDYLYNAFHGPFAVQKAELLTAVDHPDSRKQYLLVDFGRIYETGFGWEQTHKGVSTRYPYGAAWVNGQFMLIERREHDNSTLLAGRMRRVNDSEFHKVIEGIERAQPRLSGKLSMYLFDAHTNHFSGALPLCIFCGLLGLVAVWNVPRALWRIASPQRHPVYRRLARIGEVGQLEAQIDSEMASSVRRLGRCRFTQNWILHRTMFGFAVMRMEDIVWLHKKVVRHYTNGIPTGKTYAAILHDRHGSRIEIPSRQTNVDQLLSAMSQRAPWAFVGFLAQTLAAWTSNRAALVAACDERRKMLTTPPAVAA